MNLKNLVSKTWTYISEHVKGVLLLLLAIAILYILYRPTKQVTITEKSPISLDSLHQIRDINDHLYAEIQQKTLTELEVTKERDSLAKALRTKPKYIKGEDKITIRRDTVFKDSSKVVIEPTGDTAYKVEHHDRYTDIVAIAGKNSGSIAYSSRDTITRVEIEKTHWFKPTEHTILLNSANPYNTITHGGSFTVKEKTPFLTIGPYIGYDIFSKKLGFGISIQKPIFTIKK